MREYSLTLAVTMDSPAAHSGCPIQPITVPWAKVITLFGFLRGISPGGVVFGLPIAGVQFTDGLEQDKTAQFNQQGRLEFVLRGYPIAYR